MTDLLLWTDLWINFLKNNYKEIVIIFVIIIIFWFIKESLKARIRWEKAKDVIGRYMKNKKQSELDDENMKI